MRGGGLINGRNAHQAFDLEAMRVAAARDEIGRICRAHASLLRLFACVDLNIKPGRTAGLGHGLRQRACQLVPVQRLDDVKQGDSILGLVGLQWPDKPQLQIGMRRTAVRPAGLGLLDAVLTKDALARAQHGLDPLIRLLLGDRDKRDGPRIAPRPLGGGGQAFQYRGAGAGDGVCRLRSGHDPSEL